MTDLKVPLALTDHYTTNNVAVNLRGKAVL